MFAVRAGRSAQAGTGAGGGFVLPRLLRRPARAFAHLCSGEAETRPYAATIVSAAFLGLSVGYGIFAGGHGQQIVQALTSRAGFAVEEVRIAGNSETSEIDVFERIGLDGWTSLIGLDAAEARGAVLSLPWVAQASVRKAYPAALDIEIVEKQAFAIWQHGSVLTLVERNGEPIAPFSGTRHLNLPLVVGMGAAESAAEFVDFLAAEHPRLAARVKGFIRVSQRRWDLRLDSGVTVRLPEHGVREALQELARLESGHGVLSRDVVTIDLRLSDRVALRLSPEAAQARETDLKARLGRAYRPAERRI